ncbi:hypothetical protein B0J12DRAFT_773195 [Macrophomina phaseolina]|uniref:Uncharacterized protein n=1 Tax=Macrophomina phaseolina TaxID=35725 RepID=A0ABQ8FVY7_9PEZI|nr:hypothetical protein B0J12DRAFT_773195 [Macrophomina phaseolina]
MKQIIFFVYFYLWLFDPDAANPSDMRATDLRMYHPTREKRQATQSEAHPTPIKRKISLSAERRGRTSERSKDHPAHFPARTKGQAVCGRVLAATQGKWGSQSSDLHAWLSLRDRAHASVLARTVTHHAAFPCLAADARARRLSSAPPQLPTLIALPLRNAASSPSAMDIPPSAANPYAFVETDVHELFP